MHKTAMSLILVISYLFLPSILMAEETLRTEQQFQKFLALWPGEYNNTQQVSAQKRQKLDSNDQNRHLYLNIRRVDLPAFGDHAYYAEWQDYAPPHNVTRQRIYSFVNEGGVIRLDLHIFPFDPEFVARTEGAYADPSRLDGVTPEDMYELAGCSVYFHFESKQFTGAMKKQSCRFPAPDSGTDIYSWSQMRLSEDSFQYLDGWFRMKDDSIYNRISADWYIFEKQSQ